MNHFTPLVILLLTGYLANIPLGLWRSVTKKFSPGWFVAVHLSIPLIYYLRISWNIEAYYIPLIAAALVLGQLTGGKCYKKRK